MLATRQSLTRYAPGLLLCLVVTGLAMALERGEAFLAGRAWIEALVLAIILGTAIRTLFAPSARWTPGITFSAKTLLEIAVVLLGLSVSPQTVIAAGPSLLMGIAGVVVLAIGVSYGLGRLLGLSRHMAVLVACGNSICGNSAIAAVAPVIGADGDDEAASIAFTAVLGVIVVLSLPLAAPLLHLSGLQYGALAGLTVYAVPQVVAATVPLGSVAVQLGTLVKLMRVLMLGPVVLGLSIATRGSENASSVKLHKMVPWFIVGFLLLTGIRATGLVPPMILTAAASLASVLTIIAMAALGLGSDLRVVARAGGRVTTAVALSLVALGVVSLGLIRLLALG